MVPQYIDSATNSIFIQQFIGVVAAIYIFVFHIHTFPESILH